MRVVRALSASTPVRAVEMMVRIAWTWKADRVQNVPAAGDSDLTALSHAANIIEDFARPACIVALTATGRTARLLAAERPTSLVVALTSDPVVYHGLNLRWGLKPMLVPEIPDSFEGLVRFAEKCTGERGLVKPGQKILILGGLPPGLPEGTNFLKVHTLG